MLADPGSTDITSGVDFAKIASHAEQRGLVAFPTVTQHDALIALGFERVAPRENWNVRRRSSTHGKGWRRCARGAARSRATLLVDPSALGRLRWLLLATPGLPAPDWLDDPGR